MSIARDLAILATCVAALAGCGGGGGGDGTPGPAPDSPGSTQTAVAISAQPQDQRVQLGQEARFSVAASGATAYRWESSADRVDWAQWPGATGDHLNVSAAELALNGRRFRVVVAGDGSSVTSNTATLFVTEAPVQLDTQPSSTVVIPGADAVFFSFANTAGATVQWEMSTDGGSSWAAIPGASSPTLTLAAVKLSDDGKLVRAVWGNSTGEVASDAAKLGVLNIAGLAISAEPADATIAAGTTARFSAEGPPDANWQWQVSGDGGSTWANITGARSTSLSLPAVAMSDNGKRYRASVSLGVSSTTTRVALLTVVSATSRNLSLLAGQPGGPGSADGFGSDARLNWANWTASDAAGNVYVTTRCAVRKIDVTGWVSTIAGSRVCGGEDGASTMTLREPAGIVALPNGQLAVADSGTNSIRLITTDGVVSTLAGTFTVDGGAADGQGAAASFRRPTGIARDAAGNLFVADSGNHTIRKITSSGDVSTYAGRAGVSGEVDGPAATATFTSPEGIAVDSSGAVYVSEPGSAVVRKISPSGMVTTLAGSAGSKGSVDGAGSAARFAYPAGLAVDASGVLYVGDSANHTVRKVQSDGSVTTLAGTPGVGGSVDGDLASATFTSPTGLAVGPAGDLYVVDWWEQTVRKISVGGNVTTVAGKAAHVGQYDGTGASAAFDHPHGLAKDSQGNIYVGSSANALVRKVTPAGATSSFFTGNDYPKQAPWGVDVDAAGNVYVADYGAQVVRRISPTGTMTILAGQLGVAGYADGNGGAATLYYPTDVVVDPQGNLLVAAGTTIRKLTPAGEVTTFAGRAATPGSADGPAATATFSGIGGLALDFAGNLYVADFYCVRKIAAGGVVSTLAGDCDTGGRVDGIGAAARFDGLWGLDIDASGNLYVADSNNNAVRKISSSGVVTTVIGTPGIASVVLGSSPLLNVPSGIVVLDAARVAVSSENSVLIFTLP